MLSALLASRSIPVYPRGAGFDVKDAQADVIALVFATAGLARLDTVSAGGAGDSGSGHDFLGLLCLGPSCEIAAFERTAVWRRLRRFGSGL
jgi:hypothetical protein